MKELYHLKDRYLKRKVSEIFFFLLEDSSSDKDFTSFHSLGDPAY